MYQLVSSSFIPWSPQFPCYFPVSLVIIVNSLPFSDIQTSHNICLWIEFLAGNWSYSFITHIFVSFHCFWCQHKNFRAFKFYIQVCEFFLLLFDELILCFKYKYKENWTNNNSCYRSILADVIQTQNVKNLCSLFVVLSGVAAKTNAGLTITWIYTIFVLLLIIWFIYCVVSDYKCFVFICILIKFYASRTSM